MSLTTPIITNAGAVVNGDNATPAFMNSNLDPLKDFTNAIDGFSRIEVSSNYTITQNAQVVIYANASGGDITITLPASSGQLQSIVVKKIDATYNRVIVQRAGSDTIEDITTPAVSPAGTSSTLYFPNESRTFAPNGTTWRIENMTYTPRIGFRAYLSTAGVTVGNVQTKIFMNTEEWDLAGFYNNATSGAGGRYTPLVPGYYTVLVSMYIGGASSTSEIATYIDKNGGSIAQNGVITGNGSHTIPITSIVYMNGTTDYIECSARVFTAPARSILPLATTTYFTADFLHY